MKIWNKIQVKIRLLFFTWFRQGKVPNDISIFCNNCIGAFVAHDYHLPFNSPTVNLMIPPTDFIEYIEHLEKYSTKMEFQNISGAKKWPEGLLNQKIYLNFIHYKTFQDGVDAWKRRVARINKKKMFFILVETDGCTYEDLLRFDKLSHPNKIALTHKTYPEIKCAFQIKGYEKIGAVTDSYRYYKILPKRYYDQFNWRKFSNQ